MPKFEESNFSEKIRKSYFLLNEYVFNERFKGWDVFDGLNSHVFKSSAFYRSKILRLIWIQFFKKSPINFRALLKVEKGINPKGIALFVSGLVHSGRLKDACHLLGYLKKTPCTRYRGISWGYNFDWQARAFFVPSGKANIVTTVYCANSFLDYFNRTGSSEALRIAQEACVFILENLIVYEDKKKMCFGYIPGEKAKIHNANMLGAALLGRVYSITKERSLYEKSKKAMNYSMQALNGEYAWPYGEKHHHSFIDSFHTGFNLVSMRNWMKYVEDYQWEHELFEAYKYYLQNFWLEDGCPKYFNNSLYPIDIHCSAQGIITCITFREMHPRSIQMVNKIATWAIDNMQDLEGYFYYQKTKYYVNKIPYIRWAQAWMFYALSMLINDDEKIGTI